MGKTRLALEAARVASAGLTFGGCLVELAPVGDPAGVRAAIAAALELPDPTRLAELIGDRDLLIVLDNCEHVITTAAEVAEDLLRRCPRLRVLATSREGLRVGGETIWPVPPLEADDAVRLFVGACRSGGRAARSLRRQPRGDRRHLPTARRAPARDRARGRSHPGVPDRADLLAPERSVPLAHRRVAHRAPRQQTLRAVVDWSYELLFDDERRVFERLSAFPGGCDLATAEAVCADETIAEATWPTTFMPSSTSRW